MSQGSQAPTSVLFICLGNICRSPLAEGALRKKLSAVGLAGVVRVDSCGTSSYHAGEAPDPGSVRVAAANGVDISAQRSRPFRPEDVDGFDMLICMDASNQRRVQATAGDKRVWLMREFEAGAEDGRIPGVPDPWGGGAGGFEEVWRIVDRSCDGLLSHLTEGGRLTGV